LPTVETNFEDLQALIGIQLPTNIEELNEILSYVKGEVEQISEGELTIEIKDSNHPDLWSVEGIARALRGFLDLEKGLKNYLVAGASGIEISVDPALENIRPYIACAVVRNVGLTDVVIRGMMHLQDKLDQTYGRRRRRTSIGLYDFDLIKPPLRYKVSKPSETSFIPLGFSEKMTLREILKKHPKGLEHGYIVNRYKEWPIILDAKDDVLSFPPIINSNDLGRITEETKNVLIEVTGTVHETVLNTLITMAVALADRGGEILSSTVHYSSPRAMDVETPELRSESMKLDVQYVEKVLGLGLSNGEITHLLEKARYNATQQDGETVAVQIPCYRMDIMHPVDIVEDIAIAYGLNNIESRWPQMPTIGAITSREKFCDVLRDIMIGLGFQETLTYSMTGLEHLFTKMNLNPGRVVEVANPKMTTLTSLRSWLLPSIMKFLGNNTHVDYPQKIFEVGFCVIPDRKCENLSRDVKKLACALAHSKASFAELKSILGSLLSNIGIPYEIEETKHGSFIDGRVGRILVKKREVGIIGEIDPKVLESWKIENPTIAFELDADSLLEVKQREKQD